LAASSISTSVQTGLEVLDWIRTFFGQLDRDVSGGAHDARGAVFVKVASDCLQQKEKLLGQHQVVSRRKWRRFHHSQLWIGRITAPYRGRTVSITAVTGCRFSLMGFLHAKSTPFSPENAIDSVPQKLLFGLKSPDIAGKGDGRFALTLTRGRMPDPALSMERG
jgi:hypothetical protein